MTGVFPGDGTDDFIALNPYDIFEDVTIYAIDVAIEAGSENGTPVVAHLFDGLDDNYLAEQYGGLIASTAELDLAACLERRFRESRRHRLVHPRFGRSLHRRWWYGSRSRFRALRWFGRSDLGVAVRLRQHMLCLRTIWQR